MRFRDFASEVTRREGKKKNLTVADTSEVLSIAFDILHEMSPMQLDDFLRRYVFNVIMKKKAKKVTKKVNKKSKRK